MGGRIWVESQPGQGSHFHFTIEAPVIEGETALEQPAKSLVALNAAQAMSVLIVDDNATTRRILAAMVLNDGMTPTLCATAAEAIGKLQIQPGFGLILIDCNMPEPDGFALVSQIKADRALAGIPVVMLTSPGRPQDSVRCRELQLLNVSKPISQSQLKITIETALGRYSESEQPPLRSSHSPHDLKNHSQLRILLAEDNVVNQKVASRMLEKYGHSVTIASNGREALIAWERESFDLILMDVQMPEMDGLEASAAIRQKERVAGAADRTPIIALTAHAMAGDRDACLAVGMDGFVTKPIRMDDLILEISRVRDVFVKA